MRGGSGKGRVSWYEEWVLIVMYDMAWLPLAWYAGFKSVSVMAVYWVMYKKFLQHKLSEDGVKSLNRLMVKIYADNAFYRTRQCRIHRGVVSTISSLATSPYFS